MKKINSKSENSGIDVRGKKRIYVAVPVSLLNNPNLSWQAKLVWIVLMSHCNSRQLECWPSPRRISGITGIPEEEVRGGIEELEVAGVIQSIKHSNRGRTRYKINLPKGPFLRVPRWLLYHPNATPRSKTVAITIMSHANVKEDGREWAQVRLGEIFRTLGLPIDQIERDIEELVGLGILEKRNSDQFTPAKYTLDPNRGKYVPDPLLIPTWPPEGKGTHQPARSKEEADAVAEKEHVQREGGKSLPSQNISFKAFPTERGEGLTACADPSLHRQTTTIGERCGVSISGDEELQEHRKDDNGQRTRIRCKSNSASTEEGKSQLEELLRALELKPMSEWPPYWKEWFEERAGIRESGASMSRKEAEWWAVIDVYREAKELGRREELFDDYGRGG